MSKNRTNEQIAVHVTAVTMVINALLSAFKFIAGFVAGSGAMISDAVHSMSDLVSDVIVIAGRLSGQPGRGPGPSLRP